MTALDEPWRMTALGLVVRVRVTPKASRDAVEGTEVTVDGLALKVRVRAVPEDGEANTAVIRLVAQWVDVPRSNVSLASGAKSRAKSLLIGGDAEALAGLASARLGELEANKEEP